MIKLGIIGHPLGHTVSPAMHKAALRYLKVDGDYIPLDTPPEKLINRIKDLKIDGFRGFNVTIPLKVWIVPLLSEVDEYANVAGAVNTVVISKDKSLYGYNTDIDGFIGSIPRELRLVLRSGNAVIFGAGGAARAVAVGLCALGMKNITFYARNPQKAGMVRDVILNSFPDVKVNICKPNEDIELNYASIVINTTPLGMKGVNEEASPVSKKTIETLAKDAVIYDLIYRPRETKLIQYARERDLQTIGGLEMLVTQGARALSLWLDQDAPIDIMREAALKSLEDE